MKYFENSIGIRGALANTSGLQLLRLPAGTPPTPGAAIGVDASGNVVTLNAGFRAVLLVDSANAANSTTDVNAITATIPAAGLNVGSGIRLQAFGMSSNASLISGATYNFWVKLNGTKVLTNSFTTPALLAQSNSGWSVNGLLTLRSNGVSGVIALNARAESTGAATTVSNQASTATFNSTVSNTLTFGFNWSSAGATNIITCNQALISAI